MMNPCSFVTFAVATIDIDANQHGTHSAMSHLAAIALLIAERDVGGGWTFSLKRHAVAAGSGEDALLLWAINVLPSAGIVLGWQLANRIIAPLLDAGTVGDPEVGRAFLDRLNGLVTAPSIDLAVRHGGVGAPSLAEVAASHGISVLTVDPVATESAWAFGDHAWLRDQVGAEAVAVWRLWLAESNGMAGEASAAFEIWLVSRSDASV